jgi:hypothetical protein
MTVVADSGIFFLKEKKEGKGRGFVRSRQSLIKYESGGPREKIALVRLR